MEKQGKAVKYVIFHIMKKTPEELLATREYNQNLLDGDLIRPASLDQVIPQGQMSMEDLLDDEDLLIER
ncbi:hypothetical protein LJC56_09015 [Christensenellaceae bacterium OttesenSCG-928-K19]|nr:hypothetical protein [Christensenellaceae bacterium OttesenSCG-928-K19]